MSRIHEEETPCRRCGGSGVEPKKKDRCTCDVFGEHKINGCANPYCSGDCGIIPYARYCPFHFPEAN